MSLRDDEKLANLIEIAKDEDLGRGDMTVSLLPDPNEKASFMLVAKACGVFAGQEIAESVLQAYDDSIELAWADSIADGMSLDTLPVNLATIHGPLGTLLSAERVLLNFLQRLCGVATLTRQFVDAVAGTGATIFDTRKTIPGWRLLDKYAVRCGGGTNHRLGLFDAVLIKDNHLAGVEPQQLAGTIFRQLSHLAECGVTPAFVQVEADTLEQVAELYKVVGIDVILLDNFSLDATRQAIALRDDLGLRGKIQLEASGNVSLETVRPLAETGVDRISVGAITHSAVAIDLSLERI